MSRSEWGALYHTGMPTDAIYGGTFDPPHNGHINVANCFYKTGKFDKVIMVPANNPAHKKMPP